MTGPESAAPPFRAQLSEIRALFESASHNTALDTLHRE